MNSCNFVGRLCADPELRRTNEGTAVCSYSLAVKSPMVKDVTDFIDFVTWKQGAEYLAQYGHKGDVVAATGTLQPRSWTDKDGNKRKTFEVVTTSVELLSSKRSSEGTANTAHQQNGYPGGGYQQQGYGQYSQQGFQPIVGPDENLPF